MGKCSSDLFASTKFGFHLIFISTSNREKGRQLKHTDTITWTFSLTSAGPLSGASQQGHDLFLSLALQMFNCHAPPAPPTASPWPRGRHAHGMESRPGTCIRPLPVYREGINKSVDETASPSTCTLKACNCNCIFISPHQDICLGCHKPRPLPCGINCPFATWSNVARTLWAVRGLLKEYFPSKNSLAVCCSSMQHFHESGCRSIGEMAGEVETTSTPSGFLQKNKRKKKRCERGKKDETDGS